MTTPAFPPLSFAALLKRHRREQCLSQQELAFAAGYTTGYISMLERGERAPIATTAEHLAAALHLTQKDVDGFYAAARRAAEFARERERAQCAATPEEDRPPLPVGGLLGMRPEGPLVARTAELAALEAAVEAVRGGSRRMVMLAGEPGVGKTRLAQEIALRAHGRGMAVATGCCYEHLGTVALAPFVEALAHLYTYAPSAIRDEARQRWPEVVRLLPDTPGQEGAPLATAMSMTDGQQRLFWQVSGFVRAVAAARPVALLLDDLHWADEASLNLLQHLARQTRGARVLLLGTYRDTEVRNRPALRAALHELRRERLLEQLTLRTLAAEGTADLLSTLLGGALAADGADGADGRVAEALVEQIQQATGGLPLFIQEVVHSLQVRGEMDLRDGRWTRRRSGELEVTDTVRDAIGARIERLRPETQALLQEASVLGQVFAAAPLLRMGAHGEAEVEAALEEAIQAGLIEETAPRGAYGAQYSFRHALRQRAVYTAIPSPRRRRLHRAAGEALEAVHEGKRPRQASTLAWHFLEGDAVARALPYALEAGDQAEVVYAHAEAERHYQLAIELARELGDANHEAEALEKRGTTLLALARGTEALALLEQGMETYRATGDIAGVARVLEQVGEAHARAGRHQEGIACVQSQLDVLVGHGLSPAGVAALRLGLCRLFHAGRQIASMLTAAGRALEFARIAGDERLAAVATWQCGFALLFLGRLEEAIATQEEAAMLLEATGDVVMLSRAAYNLAAYFHDAGELVRAERYLERALAAAERSGDPARLSVCFVMRGDLAFTRGQWSRSHDHHRRAEALVAAGATSWGDESAAYLALGQGALDLAQGQRDRGAAALEHAVAWGESVRDFQIVRYAQAALAERDLLAGDAHAAHERLAPVLVDLHGHEGVEDVDTTDCLPILAWASLELGEQREAECLATQAMRRAEAMKRRITLVHALRVQALVALRDGRLHEAEAALEDAIARCRAMSYPYADAKALYVYGLLHAARDEMVPAREKYHAALAICAQLGERLYAEHIERALAQLDA